MRARFAPVALVLAVGTGCHPRGTTDIPPPRDDHSLFAFTNSRPTEVALDIQELRADVVGYCVPLGGTNTRLDPTRVDPALFGEHRTLRVAPGESTPYVASERVRELLSGMSPCAVFKITDDAGRSTLVAPMSPSTTPIDLTPTAFQGSWLVQRGEGYPVPEQCEPAKTREVGWSEPVPVGEGMTLKSATRDGDCALLTIGTGEAARGTAGADLSWRVCGALGGDGADLPMHAGDRVNVSISGGPYRIVDVSWTHESDVFTLLVGSGSADRAPQLVYERAPLRNRPDTKLQVQAKLDLACAPEYGACGVAAPSSIVLTVGNRTFQARAGEAVTVGRERGSTEMVVGAASLGLLTAKSCAGEAAPRVQVSLLERSVSALGAQRGRKGAIEVAQ